MFSFLLLILLNDFRILFIFCINVNVDELLLLDKNKTKGLVSLEFYPLYFLKSCFIILFYWFLFLILLNNF